MDRRPVHEDPAGWLIKGLQSRKHAGRSHMGVSAASFCTLLFPLFFVFLYFCVCVCFVFAESLLLGSLVSLCPEPISVT